VKEVLAPVSYALFSLIFYVVWMFLREKMHKKCPVCKEKNTELINENHTDISNFIDTYKCKDCDNVYTVKYDDSPPSTTDWMDWM